MFTTISLRNALILQRAGFVLKFLAHIAIVGYFIFGLSLGDRPSMWLPVFATGAYIAGCGVSKISVSTIGLILYGFVGAYSAYAILAIFRIVTP